MKKNQFRYYIFYQAPKSTFKKKEKEKKVGSV